MPSDGARDDHGDDGDDHKIIKCSTRKEERKNKTLWRSRQRYCLGSWFW